MIIGLLCCVSVGWADVFVNFPINDALSRNFGTLTLEFAVDGSGNVTLDAETSNPNAPPKAVVDAWDGAAGTVSEASLFNTTFSLVGVGVGGLITSQASQGQGLGVALAGGNPIRIDNAGLESINWTLVGAAPQIDFKSVSYENRAANGDSNLTFLDSDSRTEYLLPNTSTSGTLDLNGAGFSLANGEVFIVTADDLRDNGSARAASAGASLYGMSFEVIPEPGTLGLLMISGGGVLFIRRRSML